MHSLNMKIKWTVATLTLLIVMGGCIKAPTHELPEDKNLSSGGVEMQKPNVPTKPAEPKIVGVRKNVYNTFEEVKKAANFQVKIPNASAIPAGFNLSAIEHLRPDIPVLETTKNDRVEFFYSRSNDFLVIMQGYFSGGDIPVAPDSSQMGEVEVQGVKARWANGTVYILTESENASEILRAPREWRSGLLQLGWYKDGLGYRVESNALSLEELVRIANSLS